MNLHDVPGLKQEVPARPDLGPVIDAQLEQQKMLQADEREVLESGVDERLIAACIVVCSEDDLTPDDALQLAVKASIDERTDLSSTKIARVAMSLCRAQLTLATVLGKAFLSGSLGKKSERSSVTSRSPSAAALTS